MKIIDKDDGTQEIQTYDMYIATQGLREGYEVYVTHPLKSSSDDRECADDRLWTKEDIVDAQNHLFILKEAKEITDGTHSNN